jgi:uncharacterized membrane protein
MKIDGYQKAALALVAAAIVAGVLAYPQMPDRMASHWNAQGLANGYMDKFLGVFLLPAIMAACAALFLAIPHLDPLRKNVEKFRGTFSKFTAVFQGFMLVLYAQTLLWNAGVQVSFNHTMPFLMAFLFYYAGVLCQNAKRNWFIGVRTPWTMSSEKNWDKTNKLAGRLFKAVAVVSAIGAFFGDLAIWFAIVPVLAVAVAVVAYSYLEFRRENKGKLARKARRGKR